MMAPPKTAAASAPPESPAAADRLRAEADLIEAFTRTYGRKFSEMIDRMNDPAGTPAAGGPVSDLQCVRLCVEAVNMLLVSQAYVAKTLKQIAGPAPLREAA